MDINRGGGFSDPSVAGTPEVAFFPDQGQDPIDVPEGQEEQPARSPFSHLRVMLVEDEEEDGRLVIENLKKLGVTKFLWVKSASQAYYQLTEDKELFPDVIILELVLAGTNGIQLLTKLRTSEDEKIRNLPAVVVTTNDAAAIYRRATDQKISAYLRKPLAPGQLIQALTRVKQNYIIEKQVDFGRSWIDEVEHKADQAKAEPRSLLGWIVSLFLPKATHR